MDSGTGRPERQSNPADHYAYQVRGWLVLVSNSVEIYMYVGHSSLLSYMPPWPKLICTGHESRNQVGRPMHRLACSCWSSWIKEITHGEAVRWRRMTRSSTMDIVFQLFGELVWRIRKPREWTVGCCAMGDSGCITRMLHKGVSQMSRRSISNPFTSQLSSDTYSKGLIGYKWVWSRKRQRSWYWRTLPDNTETVWVSSIRASWFSFIHASTQMLTLMEVMFKMPPHENIQVGCSRRQQHEHEQ